MLHQGCLEDGRQPTAIHPISKLALSKRTDWDIAQFTLHCHIADCSAFHADRSGLDSIL